MTIIKLRRASAATWTQDNIILAEGEPGIELDTGLMKIGNGTNHWNDLPYTDQGEGGGGIPLSYLDTDSALTANSDTKVASQKATKSYVDANSGSNKIPLTYLDTDVTLSANSDTKIASQKATKSYVDAHAGGSSLPPIPAYWTPVVSLTNSSAALTKDREYCHGFLVGPCTIAGLAISIGGSVADGTPVIRFGIRANSNGVPGAPEIDTTVGAGSTGWKSVTGLGYSHPGGILWITTTGQGWNSTPITVDIGVQGNASTSMPPAWPWIPSSYGASAGYGNAGWNTATGYQDSVSGSLPQGFGAQGSSGIFLPALRILGA